MSNASILLPVASLAIPSADKLHPQLRAALGNVVHIAEQVDALGGVRNVPEGPVLAWVKELVTHHGMGVCSVPYLSPEYCDHLLAVFDAAGYHVNPNEEAPAQIPEIVLKIRSKPLFDCLAVLWNAAAVPLAQCIWNLEPDVPGSIQAAQYTAEGNAGTAMHHDAESDITLVVNLGTVFEGGGTEVAGDLFHRAVTVAPLKKGHAMFFKGKTQLHRGLPVTEGTRTLLVHWADLK